MADFKKGVSLMTDTSEAAVPEVDDTEYTEDEAKSVVKANEENFIQGLIGAAGFANETQRIEIVRSGKLLFAFNIHPLTATEYNDCKEKHTKYVRSKQLGMKLPETTYSVKYRSEIIYQATTEDDRKKLWGNKAIWNALLAQGLQIMGPLDVIDYCLNSMTYLGNDTDYKRWAKEAGAGDCIVDPAWKGPGTVRLVLVDGNGQPANKELLDAVFNHIVSPADRAARLLPTGCAELTCAAATTVKVNYTCTGLIYDSEHTTVEEITSRFGELVKALYGEAKANNVLRYNDVRPLLADIPGVTDFSTFLMNGSMNNITLANIEYPATGTVKFS